jgi:UDP-N-acetyl-D-glucosamine dehydrogenase
VVLHLKIENKTAQVGVIGLGYVGLPLAVVTARAGFPVIGFDIDDAKVRQLCASRSYILGVKDSELAEVQNRSSWSSDMARLAECDVIVICVPTPLAEDREPDLTFVENTAESIARHMTRDTLVVLESTTWPGTTEMVVVPILEKSGLAAEKDFFVGYSPEREDPGNTRYATQQIPKIVAGVSQESGDLTEAFFAAVFDSVTRVSSTATAEAVKITENVFRAVNIALVNELKLIYDQMGIDVWEVIDGAATKPFGYMPFYPGPGLGGHCIPIDPFYLAWRARDIGLTTRFIELAGEINTGMPEHVVTRSNEILVRERARELSGAKVLLVGVAYKSNVPDMRESPAMRILELLEDAGAIVDFLDPLVPEIPEMRDYPKFKSRRAIAQDAIGDGGFDIVLIATDHDAIDYSALIDLGCPIIDTRNAIARRGLNSGRVFKV